MCRIRCCRWFHPTQPTRCNLRRPVRCSLTKQARAGCRPVAMLLFRTIVILQWTCFATAAFLSCNHPQKYIMNTCGTSRDNECPQNEELKRFKSQNIVRHSSTLANEDVCSQEGLKNNFKPKNINRRVYVSVALLPLVSSGQITTCMLDPEPRLRDKDSIRQDYDR